MEVILKALATVGLAYAFMLMVSYTMLCLMRGRYVFFALMTVATAGTGMAMVAVWLK